MTANIKLDVSRHVGVSLALAGIGGFTLGYAMCRFMTRQQSAKPTPSNSQDKETESQLLSISDCVCFGTLYKTS